jgi:hypothetical protein
MDFWRKEMATWETGSELEDLSHLTIEDLGFTLS